MRIQDYFEVIKGARKKAVDGIIRIMKNTKEGENGKDVNKKEEIGYKITRDFLETFIKPIFLAFDKLPRERKYDILSKLLDLAYINLKFFESFVPKWKPNFSPYSPENLEVKDSILERMYERSKEQFWNDTKILDELFREYGKREFPEEKKKAIVDIFSIIYYGEIVALHAAAQLLLLVDDFQVQKNLAAQVIEEAKHVTAFGRYISELGYKIPEINRFAKKALESIRYEKHPVAKMCGMQLLVEHVAHKLFTVVERFSDDPVLSKLLRYVDIDEVKHVGLGKRYLPKMIKRLSFFEAIYIILKNTFVMSSVLCAISYLRENAKIMGINVNKWAKDGNKELMEIIKEIVDNIKKESRRFNPALIVIPDWLIEAIVDTVFPPAEWENLN